ncbi:transglycosylase SLT domain-containing protein [Fusibacter paucivorans]|uniref:Transglycosylase SLT domain-containing protein n=1 Tax=Fusibacter paucivorans TaxID=76009 RepID=A0ABS5PPU0_9FIRM|nr:transglycosylase SLT domain-containing protein [Fusibacter paucivorans]MBS7527188.1 transglycosylase SLT domain-containing protein [Fusibacter paucivorans]
MKLNHMFFYGAFIIVLISLGVLFSAHLEASEKIEVYTDEISTLTEKMEAQSALITAMQTQLNAATETLESQQDIVLKYQALDRVIDFDSIEMDQLSKANEIAENTPLDLAAATSLVKYADQFDIPYSLVLSIIDLESNFKADLVGTHEDRGYMQIIPKTESWLATAYGEELGLSYDPTRIFEPDYNLALGIKYLDVLMSSNGANMEKILSEYNRGPYNLEKYFALNQTYSTDYSRTVLNKERKYLSYNQ